MMQLTMVQTIAVWIVPVLLAITLHEVAHAWAASRCGDLTAKILGRLSLNPFKHVDPLGTIFIPILIGILSGFQFVFGWAKPVPINWQQLRHPRRDMALVALAGPMANFLMVFIWAGVVKLGTLLHPEISTLALFMVLTGGAGILINLVLAFLNLIPIPPLDGSRVVASLLPLKLSFYYARLEPFGFLIVLFLLLTGLLGWIIGTPISWAMHFIYEWIQ